MNRSKSVVRTGGLGAALAVLAGAAHGAPVVFSDPDAFGAALGVTHLESFESMDANAGAVGSLDFGGATTAEVSTFGAHENTVMDGKDGYGAVAMGGAGGGHFWKLRAGTTSIGFDSSWDAFGFWYSDLEGATLIITPEGQSGIALDDNNSGTNHFFGFVSDTPFSSVSIRWSGGSGDGVGFDDVVVGRVSVPSPGSIGLTAAGVLGLAVPRRRTR